MTAPSHPTPQEIEAALDDLRWEYEQEVMDVSTLGDPPRSRKPLINIRRRLVGKWEYFEDES